MLWREVTLFSEATRLLIPAMEAADVRRLIVVTGFGAGDSRQAMSWAERTGHGLVLGKPYADKDRQEELVRDSGLDWTIARPVILTNGRYTGHIGVHADPAKWRNGLISRADVAGYLIDAAARGRAGIPACRKGPRSPLGGRRKPTKLWDFIPQALRPYR